ncbi:uncharacterized protein GVI51_D01705 [Nakaseomyces glabratus]|uniref:D-serine dehydratase n=1 Tax=Candida glabrata (strain ATCC 2001 / BCRC 20586 / JCM 3761 / NBRC 0622 / NRRL Y-65 / CBS 138) TaxID=284593 RepID=Q6FWA0_CANGA|nr:uncharacterized protein CAGL0D01804g [Nakaseomyces glabratus]KAH7608227.1 Alanine racemase, N-terminal domain [Nakaseomyces glabratus]KAH7608344.1 Alanine racemase, N-terminal domain [Nakaseomyces glabratus]QHS65125.1 uncharacterized protein GVI51_D01705 [Nakaseomyces glabratus]CAG58405.1 unnamed protein product [Nakaseomyces glabratus]|eukprot:XP_445494.1 uncharacterized protein CAGL0D01804g [[Candida] glabrata]
MKEYPEEYLGQHISTLPTPCMVIDEKKFNSNCENMLKHVGELGSLTEHPILFRAHVKTHKTTEGTLRQLGFEGTSAPFRSKAILVSTIKEAEGLLEYQDSINGVFVDDIAFSLPACVPEVLERLSSISTRVSNLRVFVDNIDHLENLKQFGRPKSGKKWSIFLKIDMGTSRAGLEVRSEEFKELVEKLCDESVKEVTQIFGLYAHAGHSYSSHDINEANGYLIDEITAVNEAAKLVGSVTEIEPRLLTLSVGATPTANSLSTKENKKLIDIIRNDLVAPLEIHCGNYPCYDLQQYSTKCIKLNKISAFVLASIVSKYEKRNEALINAGVLALARENSSIPGMGLCINTDKYLHAPRDFEVSSFVNRVSQEHGILQPYNRDKCEDWKLGEKLLVIPQHACITMAQFPYYFVFNDSGKVIDVWKPHQKW